jgi:hypothetical protein
MVYPDGLSILEAIEQMGERMREEGRAQFAAAEQGAGA